MNAAALGTSPADAVLWAWLDPGGCADAGPARDAPLRLAQPGAARRLAELALQHVLLREVLQEALGARTGAASADADLVRQAERGLPGAFDALVERYFALVVGAAYALLSDVESARDVAQESFLEAARTLPLLRDRGKFGNWVYGIARRKAIGLLRRRRLQRAALDYRSEEERTHPTPEEPGTPLARRERAEEVRRALSQLPEIYREVLVLKYVDGRSYEEIAALLGLSLAAVDKRLTRAKGLLRESLRGWLTE